MATDIDIQPSAEEDRPTSSKDLTKKCRRKRTDELIHRDKKEKIR